MNPRLARVATAMAVAASACSGGAGPPGGTGGPPTFATATADSATPSGPPVTPAPVTSDSAPPATSAAPAATGTVTPGPAGDADARAFGGYCDGDARYRCVRLAEGLRWWGSKPALVPPGRGDVWVRLHGGSGDGWTSDDHRSVPNLCYVVPERGFRHIVNRNRFDLAVAEGAVYVCATYADASYAPSPNPHTRPVRVRGRDGLLKQGGDQLRQVDLTIPAGDDAVFVLTFVDSPRRRSEAEFLAFVESLEATAPGV